jgi:xanthine dehydrogenase small subunit
MDISTFTGAIWMDIDGETIRDAGVAYGAVAATVLRLKETESFLHGQPFELATMQAAGDVALKEITPITDVRGGADFRQQLAKNMLLKFFHEVQLSNGSEAAV